MERPRWDRKGEPLSSYESRREEYVAHHRRERNAPRVIERTETIKEVVTDHDDSETRGRLAQLEREAAESAEVLAWLLAPVEEAPEPPPLLPEPDALLADYGPVGVAPDLAEIMMPDEPLAAAVERMTPGLDELLDMAQLLSEPSFEVAIATIPTERFNDWMERLFSERGILRTKRGTDEENLSRENLTRRVETVFAKVGAKR